MAQLRTYLSQQSDKATLIALHHHPVPVGIDWVDMMQVQNADEFVRLIEPFSNVRLVVFGHIHQGFEQCSSGGAHFYGAPSSCLQVTAPEAGVAEDRPGFRLFWLYPEGRYQTQIRRVAPVRPVAMGGA